MIFSYDGPHTVSGTTPVDVSAIRASRSSSANHEAGNMRQIGNWSAFESGCDPHRSSNDAPFRLWLVEVVFRLA